MALELVKLDSATLPGIADAIRAKTGGTALLLPSEMAAAIAGIPTGGSLPALTKPAAESDVLAGKEYIDGNGNKKTGTLVVCDTVAEVDTFGSSGVGVNVEIESTADGSTKMLTLPEPNLVAENIVAGSSIFCVLGSAKTLRVETGTVTPATDESYLTIPCSLSGVTVINVYADYNDVVDAGSNTMYGFRGYISNDDNVTIANTLYYVYRGAAGLSAGASRPTDDGNNGIYFSVGSTFKFRAGITYHYDLYYWEDT